MLQRFRRYTVPNRWIKSLIHCQQFRRNYCSQRQILKDKDCMNDKQESSKFELIYSSEFYNLVYLGKVSTLVYGGICLILSPFMLLYPLHTGFAILDSLLFRGIISVSLLGIGVLVPRYFGLITKDHVLEVQYCKDTDIVEFLTVLPSMKREYYQTNINNMQQIMDRSIAFGANNIICKDTKKQFYVDTTYLDDDILQKMGFLGDGETFDDNTEHCDPNEPSKT